MLRAVSVSYNARQVIITYPAVPRVFGAVSAPPGKQNPQHGQILEPNTAGTSFLGGFCALRKNHQKTACQPCRAPETPHFGAFPGGTKTTPKHRARREMLRLRVARHDLPPALVKQYIVCKNIAGLCRPGILVRDTSTTYGLDHSKSFEPG